MKKFLYLILCLVFITVISSCTTDTSKTLPDLSGKSRAEITKIMKDAGISYRFKFSDQIIESPLDLDVFVSYNGDFKAGDKIDANYQVYVYTTVLPLTYKVSDTVKLTEDYKGKSFINDGIGEVELLYPVDGDTAMFKDPITNKEFRLRFLGIDTPETHAGEDPWGLAAANYTANRLKNAKSIVLESEGRTTDTYKRYLGFVWVDGSLLNLELVEEAYTNSTLSSSKYTKYFLNAGEEALKTGRRFYGETDPNYDYDNKKFK